MTRLSRDEKRLAALLDSYGGTFLDGLVLDDAPHFSDWQEIQRACLARLAMEGYNLLVEFYLHQERYEMSIDCAKKMIKLDLVGERPRRQLMVLLAYSGERKATLQTSIDSA